MLAKHRRLQVCKRWGGWGVMRYSTCLVQYSIFVSFLTFCYCVLSAFIKAILPMARAEAHKTCSSVNINLFGAPCELKEMQLSTYADIMRHYYWLRNENRDVYLQLVDDLVKVVSEKVTAIWIKASISVVSK
ncbi:hypothetical protein AVEN_161331-1 [Araneus ventricosus]|uniref:Uncharacterized protein n=1 Tax=Araneus ventricosus TaxID=182803 RepID=A0A4Y2WMB6_ARAVE|nr:hypothetical protein AVEN_161331-1 [Araneus ventricosus]